MNLSINAEHLMNIRGSAEKRSYEKAIDIAFDAGFRYIDLAANNLSKEKVKVLREYIDKKGMIVNQSHAPGNRYTDVDFALFKDNLKDAVEKAHILGSGIFVVHGDEFDFKNQEFSRDAALKFNYELFAPIAEMAQKYGMKLAFENLFFDCFNDTRPRFSSVTEDLIDLCDKFSSEDVGICWDFGHGRVQYEQDEAYLNEIPKLGSRLISTHVHDNYFGNDIHCFPFLGMMRWEECMQILKDLNYKGDFTFEFVYDRIPEPLLVDYMKMVYKSGEYLINL